MCFEHRRRILWTEAIGLLFLTLLPWNLNLSALVTWFFDIPEPGEMSFPFLAFLGVAIALAMFFVPLALMNWAARFENRTTKSRSVPRLAVLTLCFGPLFAYLALIQFGLVLDFSQRIFGWRLAGLASSIFVSPKFLDGLLRGRAGNILMPSAGALVGFALAWRDHRSRQPARAAFFSLAIVALRCSAVLLVQGLGVYAAIDHLSGGEGIHFGSSEAARSLEFWVLWAATVAIVFIPKSPMISAIKRLEWEGKGYVASAGTAALGVLVVAFFGVTQAVHSGIRLHRLIGLRDAFAHDVAAERLLSNEEFQQWFGTKPNASVRELYAWILQHDVGKRYTAPDWGGVSVAPDRSGFEENALALDVTISEEPAGQSGLGGRSYGLTWRGSVPIGFLRLDPNHRDAEVFRYLDRIGAERKAGEDFWSAYRRVEQQIQAENVAFPGTGFTFQIEQVVWITGGAVLVLLIITRDRVYRSLQSCDLGLNEPWLLLDARDGIANFLRIGYLTVLVALPTFLIISITRVAALQLEASKGTSKPIEEFTIFVVTELMAAGVLHISLTSVNLLLTLRKARVCPYCPLKSPERAGVPVSDAAGALSIPGQSVSNRKQ
jgi:hypothetical protein